MTGESDVQDASDMAALVAGRSSALDALIERHGEKLFRYLIRLLHNDSDAADIVQEVFVKIYQSRSRFDPAHRFSTWMYTIATNLAKDRYRWKSRHPEISIEGIATESGDGSPQFPSAGPDPSEAAAAAEQSEAVRLAIAKLSEELRTPLILAEYEGLSHIEIAGVLKCTPKAVETRIYRARQKLREQLAV
jgi:RNA polymerase sigma-70 factor (ECF subfamily)